MDAALRTGFRRYLRNESVVVYRIAGLRLIQYTERKENLLAVLIVLKQRF